MWERFSYYGMVRFILYLYEALPLWRQRGRTALRKLCGPGLCDAGDRWFDRRSLSRFSQIDPAWCWLLVAGHFGMAFEGPTASYVGDELVRDSFYEQTFYLSLAFIVVGVGLFKTEYL